MCIELGFQVLEVRTLRRAQRPLTRIGDDEYAPDTLSEGEDPGRDENIVSICLELAGNGSISDLSARSPVWMGFSRSGGASLEPTRTERRLVPRLRSYFVCR